MSFPRAERIATIKKSAIRQIVDRAQPGSINLGLGEPAFPTPQFIRQAAIDALAQPRLGYTANAGLIELRSLVAEQYQRTANEVCITNGSQEALSAVMFALLDPGDRVLLPDPGFLAYPTCAQLAGAQCDYYSQLPTDKFAFSITAFRAALQPSTKLVVLNSPSNPTGQILKEADLRAIAELLKDRDISILSDEIYSELYFDLPPISIASYYPQTIVISGLSKSMCMTGWRLGWAVGPREAIEAITIMHQYLTTCASTISQRAALVAFSNEAKLAIAEFRAELRQRRDLLVEAVVKELATDFVIPEGAFYLMLDVHQWGTSQAVAEGLLDAGVITIPGSAFGTNGEGYLRLSFSLPIDELREGIARLSKGLGRNR